MSDEKNSISPTQGLLKARQFLRDQQKTAAKGVVWGFPYADLENTTEQTLKSLIKQSEIISTDDPNMVRRGVFRFDRKREAERIRLAEDLVRRVQPGPFEDPNYLALLAYQAASIEMACPVNDEDRFSRFLLGTIHRPEINAFAQIFPFSAFVIVALNSAIIDFVYQCAKAVIEATNPIRSVDGSSAVASEANLEKIQSGLQKNPAPVDRVYRTLESQFFYGYPRAFVNEKVKEEHSPPLSILISMAERWIIAHEYGHGFALGRNFDLAPSNQYWAEEFFADTQAAILTVLSAASLDSLPPEFALSGGNFTLACLDIQRKALSILKTGQELPDEGSSSHPPYQARAQQNITVFRQFFDVAYKGKAGFDLDFVIREEPPKDHAFGSEHGNRVYHYSNVLYAIWKRVKELLLQQFQEKRPLHIMWR